MLLHATPRLSTVQPPAGDVIGAGDPEVAEVDGVVKETSEGTGGARAPADEGVEGEAHQTAFVAEDVEVVAPGLVGGLGGGDVVHEEGVVVPEAGGRQLDEGR